MSVLSQLLLLASTANALLHRASPRLAKPLGSTRMSAALDAPLDLPMEPDPDLGVLDAIRVVCTGLEFNDYPTADAGVVRLYNWMTPQGRVKLAPPPPQSGTQTGVTVEYFVEHAGGAALGALLACSQWSFIGEPRLMPATNAHGALATQMIEVLNLPEDLTLTDVLDRASVCEEILRAVKKGEPMPNMPATPNNLPQRARFLVSLEQQRRPPQLGCWLIKEILSLQKSKLQQLNEGGEEFDGPDTD
eukprot:scaffold167755_cov23-Tisochrysis_lutea.AAC.2